MKHVLSFIRPQRVIQIISIIFFSVILSNVFFPKFVSRCLISISPSLHLGNIRSFIGGSIPVSIVLPSILLIVLALWRKRVFCFFVCPLGFLQDMIPNTRKIATPGREKTNYLIFVLLFFVSLFSINLLGLFDPLVIFARFVNLFREPYAKYYVWFLIVGVSILIISIFSKRFWCFHICPLGTVFDACGVLKECIKQKRAETSLHQGRRAFLGVLAGSVLATVGLRTARSAFAQENVIRPPGALPENSFKSACVRCGNCIQVCITHGLQVTLLENGWDGLGTPRLVPRIGECDEYCNQCTQVCPSGALRPLTVNEKKQERIGIAKVKKTDCLGWSGNQLCLICGEFCPYSAIERYMKNDKIPCPIVREDLCRGCGLCENECPTQAIRVYRRKE